MNKILITSLIFISLLTLKIYGQTNDNLYNIIDTLNYLSKKFCKTNFDSAGFYAQKALKLSDEINYPTGKINAIINLAETNLYKGNTDSSLIYFNRALRFLSKKKNFKKHSFIAYQGKGKIHYNKGEYPEALEFFTKAINELPKDLKAEYLSAALNMKGLTYKRTGKLEKAQQSFIEALMYADQNDDNNMRSIILTNLGIINRNLMQYTRALEYYNQALKYLEIIKDTYGIGVTYQNIASLYSDINENKKSLKYNFLAKAILEKTNYQSINYATLLNNIGLNYDNLHKTDSAINYFNQALELSINLGDTYGIADTKINLGKVYLEENNLKKARKLIREGINTANSINAEDVAIEGYKALIDCEVFSENYKGAFTAQILLNSLHDSVYNIEKVKAINELQEKYEAEKKEKEIAIQKIELEKKQTLNKLYLILLIVIGFGLIIIGYLYRKKQLVLYKLVEKNQELAKKYERKIPNENNIIISEKQRKLYKQFIELIEKDEIYKDNDLSLEKLSKTLKTNRTETSAMINKMCETNYATLINGYRIRHAIRLLSDLQVWKKFSVEGIANDSGFKSQSLFYKLFKEQTGLAPIDFVKNK